MRTVKHQTLSLNSCKIEALTKLCRAYAREKNYWLDQLKAWNYQALLGTPRKIRDQLVKQGYQSILQARHWKLALLDAIETWDKYWSALFVQVRSKISKKLSDKARHYAYWLLKGYQQFAELMQGQEPYFDIDMLERKKTASMVRRIVKKLKKKQPKVKQQRSVKFDANCYQVFQQKGRNYLKVMSLERGKRIIIPLKGHSKIEGNITLVIKDEIEIHTSHLLKKSLKKESSEAVDFGYTEVMTDTQGLRYGKKFGSILSNASEHLHEKMQKRHRLHAMKNPKIQKYNLGRKKLKDKTKKVRTTLEREINTAINELIKTKKPAVLITENLSHRFTFNKPKSLNRKLSFWCRGKLQERVEFKALAEGFRHEQVNPAYGSQTCPNCDFVDSKNRKNDKFKCLHCRHEDVADRVAALNYARRFGDPEIELYMPYSQIKTILLDRFHRRLEMGQPMTVPGRTLETA